MAAASLGAWCGRLQTREAARLRLLLMRCVKLAVHAEAARLPQSVAIHRHQALGECISQRLLRGVGWSVNSSPRWIDA